MQIKEIVLRHKPNLPETVYVRRWLVEDLDADRFRDEMEINGKCVLEETDRIGRNIGFISLCEQPVDDLIVEQYGVKPLSKWRRITVKVLLASEKGGFQRV